MRHPVRIAGEFCAIAAAATRSPAALAQKRASPIARVAMVSAAKLLSGMGCRYCPGVFEELSLNSFRSVRIVWRSPFH
jgi:hypothetical protein